MRRRTVAEARADVKGAVVPSGLVDPAETVQMLPVEEAASQIIQKLDEPSEGEAPTTGEQRSTYAVANRKGFVVGFLIAEAYNQVALIEKRRPPWQKGLWNGIGGHIEEGEEPLAAMQREFQEETGVELPIKWEPLAVLNDAGADVYFYRARLPNIIHLTQTTDERVKWQPILNLPPNIMPNLRWTIPLAQFAQEEMLPIQITDRTEYE